MFESAESLQSPAQEEPDNLLLFTPHPMPARAGGWSAERQIAFIECLRRIGVVAAAARSVGMTAAAAYQLRKRAGPDSGFSRAWGHALDEAQCVAIDEIRTRGFGPVREAMFRGGRQVGWRERYDNRLLFAALRAMDGASGRFEARHGVSVTEALLRARGESNEVAPIRNNVAGPP
ncbi:hypothetical protein [Sphingomonas sp. LM7]|uniref:hypothetical protein n=1 Tax=Sphingomonas sp. LM7 TaxID=1938607 RepID=UPI000983FDC1|nr:hypothetical protein [Sphingomonas sp. LM7]AQR73195.1 hypothetical protein BXU08_05420 [Sphingomonas sp. LM7]